MEEDSGGHWSAPEGWSPGVSPSPEAWAATQVSASVIVTRAVVRVTNRYYKAVGVVS